MNMSKKQKYTNRKLIILISLLFTLMVPISYAANILNRIFDPGKYWVEKAAEICTDAQLECQDYRECRTTGYRDKRCNSLKKSCKAMKSDCNEARERYRSEAKK